MAEKKYLDLLGLQKYDENIKDYLSAADSEILAESKKYFEDNADRFDAAGTAATKVQELAEGAVKTNTEAIAKLNGSADAEGSVAKAIADAKSELTGAIQGVDAKADKNAGEISGLETRIGAAETSIKTNGDEIAGIKGRLETAESDIKDIKEDIGNVDELQTTSKELVDAINEVRNSVSAGGVSAAVTITTATTTDGMLKSYTVKQGETVVGTIDIPKDMVVESGTVVELVDGEITGYAAGTYIKLILANVADPLYINVGTLIDIYTAQANAAQVQVNIDSASRVISATIVAGSIGTAELADNAVVTAKIADKNVTKSKLSAEVQASLDKADVAETNAKAYADELNGDMDERMAAVEAKLGTGEDSVEEMIATAKSEAISAAASDAASKDEVVLKNAKDYADEKVAGNKALIDANAGDIASLNGRMGTAESDIDKIEESLAEGGSTANAIAVAKKAGDDAQTAVNNLTVRVGTNETNISGNNDRITALESKVGDGFVTITTEEIEAMFA